MAIKAFCVEIPRQGRAGCDYNSDVAEFLASGEQNAEIIVPDCSSVHNVSSGLRFAIKRNPDTAGKIAVVRRGGRVFLKRLGV